MRAPLTLGCRVWGLELRDTDPRGFDGTGVVIDMKAPQMISKRVKGF